MKLSELEAQIAEDFPWDESHIEGENSKSTKLWIKYIKIWSDENLKVEVMENNLKKLIHEKQEYYGGNAPAHVYKEKPFDLKLRSDKGINKYVDGDEDIIKAREQILIQKQKVVVLQACLDEVKRRGFAIKNAIEYYKFINGG